MTRAEHRYPSITTLRLAGIAAAVTAVVAAALSFAARPAKADDAATLIPKASGMADVKSAGGKSSAANFEIKTRRDSLVLSLAKSSSTVLGLGLYFDLNAKEFTIPQIGRTHGATAFKGKVDGVGTVDGHVWRAEEKSGKGESELLKSGSVALGRVAGNADLCAFDGKFRKIVRGELVLDERVTFTYACPKGGDAVAH